MPDKISLSLPTSLSLSLTLFLALILAFAAGAFPIFQFALEVREAIGKISQKLSKLCGEQVQLPFLLPFLLLFTASSSSSPSSAAAAAAVGQWVAQLPQQTHSEKAIPKISILRLRLRSKCL